MTFQTKGWGWKVPPSPRLHIPESLLSWTPDPGLLGCLLVASLECPRQEQTVGKGLEHLLHFVTIGTSEEGGGAE